MHIIMEYKFDEKMTPLVQRAEKYCATDEHCRSSVRAKLLVWGANRQEADYIVQYLVEQDLINEQRYASTYCGSKLRMQKWGRVKMAYQLRSKQIPKGIIEKTLDTLDMDAYRRILFDLCRTKWEQLATEQNPDRRRTKVINFLSSKGFELNEIQQALNIIINSQQ